MENNNTVNTVTIPLEDYNSLKNEVKNAEELAFRWKEQINVLERERIDRNKIVVVERKVASPYGGHEVAETLKLNIEDPATATKLLDIISKADTSELSQKVEEKETEIRNLKTKYQEALDMLENTERMFKHSARRDEDAKKEEIRKLKKGYEDSILDLEIDKETLTKALADLKKDKTQAQIELARQEEIDDLKSKVIALEQYQSRINNTTNPWKLRRFIQSVKDSQSWIHANAWAAGLYSKTLSAVERVQSFTKILSEVGKLPERENKKKYCEPVSTPAYYSYGTCSGCTCMSASRS